MPYTKNIWIIFLINLIFMINQFLTWILWKYCLKEQYSSNETYDNTPIVETITAEEINDTPAFVKPDESFEETIFDIDSGANEEPNDYSD